LNKNITKIDDFDTAQIFLRLFIEDDNVKRASRTEQVVDIYVHVEEHVTIFSGIKFIDFIECTPISIENMLLLKANYVGKKHFCKFELLEGMGDISELLSEDIYDYGDFCFVDYVDTKSVNQLGND